MARWAAGIYWVDVSGDAIDRIQACTCHAWYAHFWQDDRLLVVYDDARFSMHRHDQTIWRAAVDHGLQQGLRPEWLDSTHYPWPTTPPRRDLQVVSRFGALASESISTLLNGARADGFLPTLARPPVDQV